MSHHAIKRFSKSARKASKYVIVKPKEATLSVAETRARFYEKLENEYRPADIGLTKMTIPKQQICCINMLASGHPKAFIEFFELTHGEEDPELRKLDINDMPIPPVVKQARIEATLEPLSTNFITAELASRSNDYEKLFHSRLQIAKTLEISGELNKAIYCYAKCNTVANRFSKRNSHLCEVKHNLGKVYERLDDIPKATLCYEEYLKLSETGKSPHDIVNAAVNLLKVYVLYAGRIKGDNPIEGIAFLEKAVTMATICGNEQALGEAKYNIGLLYERLGKHEIALKYQNEYLEICVTLKDILGESKAHEALSIAYEANGDTKTATGHMEQFLESAEGTDLDNKARASCKLGILYNRHKQAQRAVAKFEIFYQMACELKNIRLMDQAKYNLGIARGTLKTVVK